MTDIPSSSLDIDYSCMITPNVSRPPSPNSATQENEHLNVRPTSTTPSIDPTLSPVHQEQLASTTYLNPQPSTAYASSAVIQLSKVRVPIFGSWWWWWEIGGALLSAICMCLIIVILAVMNERALDRWTLPIQPNSLIAVFTTIGKTGLLLAVTECISQLKWLHFEHPHNLAHVQLFDDASRGPWGAMVFLWKYSWKSNIGHFRCDHHYCGIGD